MNALLALTTHKQNPFYAALPHANIMLFRGSTLSKGRFSHTDHRSMHVFPHHPRLQGHFPTHSPLKNNSSRSHVRKTFSSQFQSNRSFPYADPIQKVIFYAKLSQGRIFPRNPHPMSRFPALLRSAATLCSAINHLLRQRRILRQNCVLQKHLVPSWKKGGPSEARDRPFLQF